MKEKINNIITCFFIGIVILAFLFFSGCDTQQQAAKQAHRTEKKAERKLYKSIAIDRMPFTRECAYQFNPIDSIHERVIYKPGETITDTFIATELDIVRDTVFIKTTKTITVNKTDTVDLSRFQTESNKAAQDSLKRHYERKENILTEALNKEQVEHSATRQSLKTYKTGFFGLLAIIVVYVVIKLFWGKITGWFK